MILRARKGVVGHGRRLARAFNCNEVTAGKRPEQRIDDGSVVLSYGVSKTPIWFDDVMGRGINFINTPEACRTSIRKVDTFEAFNRSGVDTLEWCTHRATAQNWVDKGHEVIVRSEANGRMGVGIGLVGRDIEDGDHTGVVPEAPLYTIHYKKTKEFRAFIVNGRCVALVQKKRVGKARRDRLGIELDNLVRSHKRGWVFAHSDLRCTRAEDRAKLEQLGIDAAAAVGLGFAAIDILAKFRKKGNMTSAVVCETNSAPGMSSPTTFRLVTWAIIEEYLYR